MKTAVRQQCQDPGFESRSRRLVRSRPMEAGPAPGRSTGRRVLIALGAVLALLSAGLSVLWFNRLL